MDEACSIVSGQHWGVSRTYPYVPVGDHLHAANPPGVQSILGCQQRRGWLPGAGSGRVIPNQTVGPQLSPDAAIGRHCWDAGGSRLRQFFQANLLEVGAVKAPEPACTCGNPYLPVRRQRHLLRLLQTEEIPYWRAVAANLLDGWTADKDVTPALLLGLNDTNALCLE